jgi:hypothetical protein
VDSVVSEAVQPAGVVPEAAGNRVSFGFRTIHGAGHMDGIADYSAT